MLNQIFNEDCLEGMKRIPDGSIDCIITDPPYWTTACKWDSVIPFDKMWEQLKRIIKPNGAIVLFWSEPFSSALRMSNIKQYKYDWIWEKQYWTNFMQKWVPIRYHEIISVFYNRQPIFNEQRKKVIELDEIIKMDKYRLLTFFEEREYDSYAKIDRRKNINNPNKSEWTHLWDIQVVRKKDDGYRKPKSILKINWSKNNNVHPTQKPVALIEYLIRTYTNEWETILDFTMGSGTTAIACINTNRNYIGFELDKWYCDIAQERIRNHLNK